MLDKTRKPLFPQQGTKKILKNNSDFFLSDFINIHSVAKYQKLEGGPF